MKRELGVVIPFVNTDRVLDLVDMIMVNTVPPDVVVLVDNSQFGVKLAVAHPISIIRLIPPPGVNASWEIGTAICGDVNFITFLNDDVLLNPTFFERIRYAFETDKHKDIGVICPNTVSKNELRTDYNHTLPYDLEKNKHPEGWAFTIRREIMAKAMPFPAGMIHFAGDDWLWWITYEECKMKWYTDQNNLVYHAVGASQTRETRARLKEDHEICSKALLERFPERHAVGARRKQRQQGK